MSVKMMTQQSQISAYLNNRVELLMHQIVDNLIVVGEKALAIARNEHKYLNQTGNLASSIGYCILVDGEVVVKSSFEVVGNGYLGSKQGSDYLNKLIDKHGKGIVFIMVAGMNYAKYVEAMNLDVLESAEMMSERMIPQLLKELQL